MKRLNIEDFKSNEEEFDFDKAYQDCFVDVTKKIDRPPVALGIGTHEYKNQTYLNPTFTYGELSAIVAPQKSKKSFFKRAIASTYIGGQSQHYFPSIKSKRDSDRYVLDFDTEQGKYYAQRSFVGVCEMVGSNYENYLPFGIKKLSDKEMLLFIDGVIQKYKSKIGMVFIDGIADLCSNPNDINQSNEVVNKLKEWTEYGIHICCVIHKTFEKDKAFGHLGTYVQKKCETSIFLEVTDANVKNSPIKVTQKDSRGAPFDDFYFDLDLNNLTPKECEQQNW
tara:strand:- start:86 stop:925 length:840 start_codon:yes stop_codon:yes gene_type:complete